MIWSDFVFLAPSSLKKKKRGKKADIGCLCCSCGKRQTVSHLGGHQSLVRCRNRSWLQLERLLYLCALFPHHKLQTRSVVAQLLSFLFSGSSLLLFSVGGCWICQYVASHFKLCCRYLQNKMKLPEIPSLGTTLATVPRDLFHPAS